MGARKGIHHDDNNVFSCLGKTEESIVIVWDLVGSRFPLRRIAVPLTSALPQKVRPVDERAHNAQHKDTLDPNRMTGTNEPDIRPEHRGNHGKVGKEISRAEKRRRIADLEGVDRPRI